MTLLPAVMAECFAIAAGAPQAMPDGLKASLLLMAECLNCMDELETAAPAAALSGISKHPQAPPSMLELLVQLVLLAVQLLHSLGHSRSTVSTTDDDPNAAFNKSAVVDVGHATSAVSKLAFGLLQRVIAGTGHYHSVPGTSLNAKHVH